jgi:hypothetical protein
MSSNASSKIIESYFEFYKNWSQVKVFYSIETNRIEFLYLICESPEEAKRVMSERLWFTQKLKRYHVKISPISNDILKAAEHFSDPENVAVVIKPPGNLEVIEELPEGPELLVQVQQLVKMITQLDGNQVGIG